MVRKESKKGKSLKSSLEEIINSFYNDKEGEKFYKELKKEFNFENISKELEKNVNFRKKLRDYEIEQGDIIVNYPNDFLELKLEKTIGLIIGNYTCDIPKNETRRLHILPIFPLKVLSFKLLKTFVGNLASQSTRDKFNPNNIDNLKETYDKFSKNDKKNFIDYIKKIFQFKNRNFFLLCPHKELGNTWNYVDIQSIVSIIKNLTKMIDIIKYTKISINSPWKEKFGSILSSRFGKIAVDDFSSQEIKHILTNL